MNLTPAPFHADVAYGPEGGTAYWLTTADDIRIRMGVWALDEAPNGTVLIFPGRTEYIEKYGSTATEFQARGFSAIAMDWRGQGLADRMTSDRAAGYVVKYTDFQHDVAAMLDALRALDLPEPYYLLGHSMGGSIGLRALMEGLPVEAAMFTGPMWGIKLDGVKRPAAWALASTIQRAGQGHRYAPGTSAASYVLANPFEGNLLTSDAEMYARMQEQLTKYPDLLLGGPTLGWLHEALVDCRTLSQRPTPDVPCLTFLGTKEEIVDTVAIHDRMARWHNGALRMMEGVAHEVVMEGPETRKQVFDEAAAFFNASQSSALPKPSAAEMTG